MGNNTEEEAADYQLKVRLAISEFASTARHIVDVIGVPDSVAYEKGEIPNYRGATRPRIRSYVNINSSNFNNDITVQIDDLINKFISSGKIKLLPSEARVLLSIVVKMYTGTPPLGLTAKQMQILAENNIDVDIDLYCLGGEE